MEKRTASKMLVQANTLKEAISLFEEGMKGTLADYVLSGVKETAIVDVFPFEKEGERGECSKES